MSMTIVPYLLDRTWVFDDPRAGLKEEAFVLGMSEMISRVVNSKGIPNADRGFTMIFDAEPFDHDVELNWMPLADVAKALNQHPHEIVTTGNWYRGAIKGEEMVGWLCPALFLYFDSAPSKIYVKVGPLPQGVDPIWHIDKKDPRAKQFVSADDVRFRKRDSGSV